MCYTLYIATFILSSYRGEHPDSTGKWYINKTFIIILIYFAAILNGFGASILWLAQGKYTAMCANDSNKGLFNGTFWAIFMSANIVGYLMSAFVLGAVKSLSVFYLIMTIICFCSSLFFLFLSKPDPHPEEASAVKEAADEQKVTMSATWDLMKSKRMRPLLPVFISSAYSVSFFSALFIPYMTFHMNGLNYTDAEEEKLALLAMIGLGVGEILGSIVHGRIIDRFSLRTAIYCILGCYIFALFWVVLFNAIEYFAMWRAVVMTFSWGFYDSGNMTFVNSMCGFQFESKSVPFSVFLVVQSFMVFVFLIYASTVTTTAQYYIFFLVGILANSVSFASVLCFFEPKPKESKQDDAF